MLDDNRDRPLRVAVIGSRKFNHKNLVVDLIYRLRLDEIVISGGADGVDKTAEITARARGMAIEIFKPDWKKYGKAAGFVRNGLIVNACDMLFAFWDGKSKGTLNSIELAGEAGKQRCVCDENGKWYYGENYKHLPRSE